MISSAFPSADGRIIDLLLSVPELLLSNEHSQWHFNFVRAHEFTRPTKRPTDRQSDYTGMIWARANLCDAAFAFRGRENSIARLMCIRLMVVLEAMQSLRARRGGSSGGGGGGGGAGTFS